MAGKKNVRELTFCMCMECTRKGLHGTFCTEIRTSYTDNHNSLDLSFPSSGNRFNPVYQFFINS